MMVENCSTESPSTYEASAPAASSYTSPQAATTNTEASSATSSGRGAAAFALSMYCCRHDHRHADRHRPHGDRQREVLLLDDLFPQLVRRELVDEDEASPEHDDADQG